MAFPKGVLKVRFAAGKGSVSGLGHRALGDTGLSPLEMIEPQPASGKIEGKSITLHKDRGSPTKGMAVSGRPRRLTKTFSLHLLTCFFLLYWPHFQEENDERMPVGLGFYTQPNYSTTSHSQRMKSVTES